MRLLKPHPRARVWEQERHRYLPARSVRPIYRLLIPPIASLSAHGSRRSRTAPAPPVTGSRSNRSRREDWLPRCATRRQPALPDCSGARRTNRWLDVAGRTCQRAHRISFHAAACPSKTRMPDCWLHRPEDCADVVLGRPGRAGLQADEVGTIREAAAPACLRTELRHRELTCDAPHGWPEGETSSVPALSLQAHRRGWVTAGTSCARNRAEVQGCSRDPERIVPMSRIGISRCATHAASRSANPKVGTIARG
jgi:hypothetical protein